MAGIVRNLKKHQTNYRKNEKYIEYIEIYGIIKTSVYISLVLNQYPFHYVKTLFTCRKCIENVVFLEGLYQARPK